MLGGSCIEGKGEWTLGLSEFLLCPLCLLEDMSFLFLDFWNILSWQINCVFKITPFLFLYQNIKRFPDLRLLPRVSSGELPRDQRWEQALERSVVRDPTGRRVVRQVESGGQVGRVVWWGGWNIFFKKGFLSWVDEQWKDLSCFLGGKFRKVLLSVLFVVSQCFSIVDQAWVVTSTGH